MRILKQTIEKKMDNESFLIKCGQEDLAYQEHLSAYLLSLLFLNIPDKDLKKKELIWKKFTITRDRKYLLLLQTYKSIENGVIMKALEIMDFQKEQEAQRWGSLFGDFAWAILSYEHEESE